MIKYNVQKILAELPDGVELVAAAKTRTPEEILEAVEAGVKIIGEIPYDENFTKAMISSKSIVEYSNDGEITRCFEGVYQKILQQLDS